MIFLLHFYPKVPGPHLISVFLDKGTQFFKALFPFFLSSTLAI